MSINVNDISFYSGYPIDKIMVQGSTSFSVAGSATNAPNQVLETISNPSFTKGIGTVSWSTDNTNFYDQDDQTFYFNNTFNELLQNGGINCGSDNSFIYFFISNGFTATQTFYINYTLYSIS